MTETSTELTPSAGEAVRTELSRIMNDPTHAWHGGYKRNDPEVSARIDAMYRKVYGEAPAFPDRGITVTSSFLTPPPSHADAESMEQEARHAQVQAELRLQQAMGDSFEPELRSARSMAARMFATPESLKVLDEVFAPLISGLGPHGEALAVRFLAELNRLHTNHHAKGA